MMFKRSVLVGAMGWTLAGCYDADPQVPDADILMLSVAADSAPADGATIVPVVARIPADARDDRRSVAFATSAGTFVEGGGSTTSSPAIRGEAVADLRAPRIPTVARIRATVDTHVRDTAVAFVAALPDRIEVEPSAFVLAAGLENGVTITAYLRRTVGQVTPGTEVTFRAVKEGSDDEIGRFGVARRSDESGTVTVRYSAGPTDYRGPVRIIASVEHAETRLVGQTAVAIVDPESP